MPIDASNSPNDGGLGPDPAGTGVGADDIVVASKSDVDLGDAGTGAKSPAGVDLPGTDGDTNPKAGLDLSLDDAGRGAKVDPSLRDDDDDPVTPADKSGVGGALDDVEPVGAVKDLDLGLDADGGKDLDIGAPDPLHEEHVKGLTDVSDDHDDHDHDHDGGHDELPDL